MNMDKNLAFIEINYLFNSIENENKSNSEKLDQLRIVLDKLQKESYDNGFKNGVRNSIKTLEEQVKKL